MNLTSFLSRYQRFGISVDARVSGVLVQDQDGVRHGNVYTFSERVATIEFSSDPITVLAGETNEVRVLVHLDSNSTCGTIGAKITNMSGDP